MFTAKIKVLKTYTQPCKGGTGEIELNIGFKNIAKLKF